MVRPGLGRRHGVVQFLALLLATGPVSAGVSEPCDELLPVAAKRATGPVTARDMVGLREVGDAYPGAEPALAISPSGDALAFVVRRADPDRNSYCVGLVVLPLREGRAAVLADTGQTLLRDDSPWLGLSDLGSGRPLANLPVWSADGRSLFYLRAHEGRAQVWRVDLESRRSAPITDSPTGILWFRLAPDGLALFYASRPGLVAARRAIEKEGHSGWLYDQRFWTVQSNRPFPLEQPAVVDRLELSTGEVRPASADELEAVSADQARDAGRLSELSARAGKAMIEPSSPGSYFSPGRLVVRAAGAERPCPVSVCDGRVWQHWATRKGLVVLRDRRDDPEGMMEVRRWRPGRTGSELLWEGRELLAGCVLGKDALYCMHEASAMPPRVVRLGLDRPAGLERLIDLNPQIDAARLGHVQRLSWRDRNGLNAFGDLVTPARRRPGERLPLIVVQYESRSFLRGGTGDEYPIHVLAGAGYAVLSVHAPRRAIAEAATGAADLDAFQRRMVEGHYQRARLWASLDAGIDAAVATGRIDPERIGLTGMSDGQLTACYALIHRPRFKAVALSGGCEEPDAGPFIGPGWAERLRRWGVPDPHHDPNGYWDGVSLARAVDRIKIPILIQAADAEMLTAVPIFAAYRAAGRPVEMIVYPGEYHNKWQPVHRLAVYETNLLWFDFWLRGREHAGEGARYARWRSLRAGSSLADMPSQ